jgi:hypothetical protein
VDETFSADPKAEQEEAPVKLRTKVAECIVKTPGTEVQASGF